MKKKKKRKEKGGGREKKKKERDGFANITSTACRWTLFIKGSLQAHSGGERRRGREKKKEKKEGNLCARARLLFFPSLNIGTIQEEKEGKGKKEAVARSLQVFFFPGKGSPFPLRA